MKKEYIPKNKIKDREKAIFKQIYNSTVIKRNRKNRIIGDITLEDFIFLSKQPCNYCGMVGSNLAKDRRGGGIYSKGKLVSDTCISFNGLDRLDSNKFYTKENVTPCCKYCNTAKNTMTKQEFLNWIKKVYEYNF